MPEHDTTAPGRRLEDQSCNTFGLAVSSIREVFAYGFCAICGVEEECVAGDRRLTRQEPIIYRTAAEAFAQATGETAASRKPDVSAKSGADQRGGRDTVNKEVVIQKTTEFFCRRKTQP